MKSTKGAILGYVPAPPPADLAPEARRYLDEELSRIAGVLANLLAPRRTLMLEPMTVAPATPVMPQIVYADGLGWDPGSGAGYYYWNGVIWTPLG